MIWLVKARPLSDRLPELRKRLDSGEVSIMRPFGRALDNGLRNARLHPDDGYARWVEEDYCNPPLAMEREALLDNYFEDLSVEDTHDQERGWRRIKELPSLWAQTRQEKDE